MKQRKSDLFRCVSVLTLAAIASTTAHAQSAVTLYGLIDEGLNYTNNTTGGKVWELASGYIQGSRWGLKGNEDLGGGYQAIFQLENGYNLSTGSLGQGGREFGRQAYVGLSGTNLGTVTLGRQYDSQVDTLSTTTACGTWGGFLFCHPFDNDNLANSYRVNNAVKYSSPTLLGGLNLEGTYALSNSTDFSNNRAWSVGATYGKGPLLLAASFMNLNNVGSTTSGAVSPNETSFIAGRSRSFGAGVNYSIAKATLGFTYSHTKFDNPTATPYVSQGVFTAPVSSLKFDNFEINLKYDFTPSFFVAGMYTYTAGKVDSATGSTKPKWHQAGLMADYFLSKRTDVYVQGAYQKVAGGSTGTFLDNADIPGADDSSTTGTQLMARVGIRHKF